MGINSKMKCLFIVERPLYYKFFGSLISEIEKNDGKCYFLHRYSITVKENNLYFPYLYLSNDYRKTLYFSDNSDIINFIKSNCIEFIFSLHSCNYYNINKESLTNTKWCSIQHGFDFLSEKDNIFSSDYIFLYSNSWIYEFFHKEIDKISNENLEKIHYVGSPQFDNISEYDDEAIRNKYNLLDYSKKILVYFPLDLPKYYVFLAKKKLEKIFIRYNYPIPYNGFEKIAKKITDIFFYRYDEERVLETIKQFCSNNNAYFIVKSRFKRLLPDKFFKYADKIFYDDSLYPSTINELAYISDIFITTLPSLAVAEGIKFNNFNIILNINSHIFENMVQFYIDSFSKKCLNIFFPENLFWSPKIKEFVDRFPKKKFSDFSVKKCDIEKYLNKYYNQNKSSSNNIIKILTNNSRSKND